MLFKPGHTQRSSLSSRTFFPIIQNRRERQKEKYKSRAASEANNGHRATLTFTQQRLRAHDANGFVKNALVSGGLQRWSCDMTTCLLFPLLPPVHPPPPHSLPLPPSSFPQLCQLR